MFLLLQESPASYPFVLPLPEILIYILLLINQKLSFPDYQWVYLSLSLLHAPEYGSHQTLFAHAVIYRKESPTSSYRQPGIPFQIQSLCTPFLQGHLPPLIQQGQANNGNLFLSRGYFWRWYFYLVFVNIVSNESL